MKIKTPEPGADKIDKRRISISPEENSGTRILGSYSAVTRFKKIDSFPGDDLPGDRADFPLPLPLVSSPDIALQFKPALAYIPVDNLEGKLISALQKTFGDQADVRYRGAAGTGQVGIWLRPFVSETANQARTRGVANISILKPLENFAFFINAAYIKRLANEAWANQPKRLNGDMQADSHGPIHLTSLSVLFQSPDKIVTTISGFDERPWPDVDFKLTISDVLSASGWEVNVDSTTDLDVDTSWFNFLTGVFLIVFPPLGLVFLAENIYINSKEGAVDNPGGVGSNAAAFLPKEIMIEGDQKLSFLYTLINVTTGGLFAGGTVLPLRRIPKVRITGSAHLSASSSLTSVSSRYTVTYEDLRGHLRYRWQVDGLALSDTTKSPLIRFSFSSAQPGDIIKKKVKVTVTDEDGLSATAEIEVKIHIAFDDDNGLPPICRIKPYLPQCQISI